MAVFTSVQSGNWNDGATWGNTSPGVKGTDWPGLEGDTFTIAAGHTVVYNVSEAAELGASTINGTLEFVTTASTKLAFGNATLAVSSTGVLRVGTEASPIPAAYTAEIVFNTTTDNAQGLTIAVGGQYSICGDPSYCSSYSTTLAADAENTDGDTVITTVDDMSSVWHVGDEITIRVEKMGDSSTYTDAVRNGVIQSISGSSITLDISVTCQSGVGDTWISYVENITRNVKTYKYGAVTDISSSSRYNTNRPYFIDSNTTGSNICRYVQFTGFNRVTLTGGAAFTHCVIRNSSTGIYASSGVYDFGETIFYCLDNAINACIEGIEMSHCRILGCQMVWYGSRFLKLKDSIVYCCSYVSRNYYCHIENVAVVCVYAAIGNGARFGTVIGGSISQCTYALFSVQDMVFRSLYLFDNSIMDNGGNNLTFINCVIGYNTLMESKPNSSHFAGSHIIKMIGCELPLMDMVIPRNSATSTPIHLMLMHKNNVLDAHAIHDNLYDLLKVSCDGTDNHPSIDPDGGNAVCIEISNLQAYLGSRFNYINIFEDYKYTINALVSVQKTYTFKIQSLFTTTLTADDLYIEAMYLSSATDATYSIVKSAQTVAPRSSASDWSQVISVTITPAQTGVIFFQIKLSMYESGKLLYVWPEIGIA